MPIKHDFENPPSNPFLKFDPLLCMIIFSLFFLLLHAPIFIMKQTHRCIFLGGQMVALIRNYKNSMFSLYPR